MSDSENANMMYEKRPKHYEERKFKDKDDDKDENLDKKKVYLKRKVCRFCLDKSLNIDYKNDSLLRRFTTEGGKIIPRRMSGNCAKHQRMISAAIKRV